MLSDSESSPNFKIIKKIGQGGCSKVFLIKFPGKNTKYALKIVKHTADSINEILINKELNHGNITKMVKYYIDVINSSVRNDYLIFEHCNNGSLFFKMTYCDFDEFDDNKKKDYLIQIVLALQYLKSNLIVHRDIKPENIFLHDNVIKIGDFGISRKLDDPNQRLMCKSGTRQFTSHEMFADLGHSFATDVWALGVVMYLMFYNTYPFLGDKENLKNKVIALDYENNSNESKMLLIKKMLCLESKRVNIDDILNEPYFTESNNSQSENTSETKNISDVDITSDTELVNDTNSETI
jgi:NIMA (never in mitosis gene a)-related kinase